MTHTVPAIRGKMGSTTYYQAVMRADELVATVRPAMDFEEFRDVLVSEKMQRALNEKRVEEQIVPYLTNSADRFFGSIIVLVYEPETFIFESLSSLNVSNLKSIHSSARDATGVLSISGGKLFALDGQHRLHALRTVINHSKTPRLGLNIDGPYKNAIKSDMLSVIFLEFESVQKARRIFNKVNRYAKPTTKSVNILTSEDDGLAIIARALAGLDHPGNFDSLVPSPIPLKMSNGETTVELSKNSLSREEKELMTIELLHKSVDIIATATNRGKLDEMSTKVRPPDLVLCDVYDASAAWWKALMQEFVPFALALEQPNEIPELRKFESEYSVAFRPVGQESILRGLLEAHRLSKASPTELIRRLNKVQLSLEDELWGGLLLGGGAQRRRVLTTHAKLAGDLIVYLIVGPNSFGASKTSRLQQDVNTQRVGSNLRARELPRPVV